MRLIALILLIFTLNITGAKADNDDVYKGLSNFTRVLDLIQRNYVENVDGEELTNKAIEGMLQSLDPYSAYLSPERYRDLEIGTSGEFVGVGMEVTTKNGYLNVITPIEGGPADKAGIKPKDLIIEIEGESTKGMVVQEAVNLLRGPKGSSVNITVEREGVSQPLKITLVRDKITVKSVKYRMLDNQIGYIRLAQFQENSSQELRSALSALESQNGKKLRGVVLDLRNNPGGLLGEAIEIVDEFIDQGLIVSVRGRTEGQAREYYATKNGDFQEYPIVVIVNDGSASASEVVAEALQDSKRATILGTNTFGKGSVQTIIRLEDGSGLKLTTAKFYAPSGRSISEIGVTPDVIVENDDSNDKQLDTAIEILKSSAAKTAVPKG
ncbi:MAG: S41 family peptidase [Thermodesulfobacteriales bacterium]|nr:MAG: S41 family peptidase [Thermodesulfobacteriales bacterium]